MAKSCWLCEKYEGGCEKFEEFENNNLEDKRPDETRQEFWERYNEFCEDLRRHAEECDDFEEINAEIEPVDESLKQKIDSIEPEEYKDLQLDYFQQGKTKILPQNNKVKILVRYESGRCYSRLLSRQEWEDFFRKCHKMQLVLERRDERIVS